MLQPIMPPINPFSKEASITDIGEWWIVDSIHPIVAYQPKGATNYANSLINLDDPGTLDAYNDDSAAGDPDWSTNDGWIFDGSDSLNTHINALSTTPVAMIMSYTGFAQTTSYAVGAYDGNRWHFGTTGGATDYFSNGSSSFVQVSGYQSSAIIGFSGANAFRDGTKVATNVPTGTKPDREIQIGGLGIAGPATQNRATIKIKAIAIYDTTLTDTQMQTLTTRLSGL